tara:strand:+ start:3335 stop:4219 length:885 start_codon:yes stop_codon:yes gene_type:complete
MELRKIKVYGKLRKLLGENNFEAAVNSPKQAFDFLRANFEEFDQHMNQQLYKVKMGGRVVTQDEISFLGQGDIQIVPVAAGSGLFDFLGDVFDFIVDNAIPFVTAFFTGGISLLATVAGITLATDLLSNNRPASNQSSVGDTDPNIRGSYAFNGIQNVSTSGVPVPILYGHVFSGSVLISAGVDTVQLVALITDEGTYSKPSAEIAKIFISNHGLKNGETIALDWLTGPIAGRGTLDTGGEGFAFFVKNVTADTFEVPLGMWGPPLGTFGNSSDNTVRIVDRNPDRFVISKGNF